MTHQLHENIIYEGRDLSMTTCPKVPLDNPRVIELTDKELFATGQPRVVSSSCWRGYLGSWEIKDGRLYLIGLERNLKLEGFEPLFAGWVNEELNIIVDLAFEGLKAGLHGGEKIKKVQIAAGIVQDKL
jgi:hypothetical protein